MTMISTHIYVEWFTEFVPKGVNFLLEETENSYLRIFIQRTLLWSHNYRS